VELQRWNYSAEMSDLSAGATDRKNQSAILPIGAARMRRCGAFCGAFSSAAPSERRCRKCAVRRP
jgi:hypothetical protein